MILVTVGTQRIGFERLIKKMDEIAGKIDEEIIMQIGSTAYTPKYAKFFDFKNFQEMQELYREARIVVCHGGAGSILDALSLGKPVIAVARLKKYDEILIEHQPYLIDALARAGKITVVNDLEYLEDTIRKCSFIALNDIKKDNRLILFLKNYVNNEKC